MRKVLIFFTGVFGFILIFSVSAIISYFMYPGTQETAADEEGDAVQMNFGGEEAVSGSSELTIVTPALDKTKTIVSYGSMAEVLGDDAGYAEEDTYPQSLDGADEEEAVKSEDTQSAPQNAENLTAGDDEEVPEAEPENDVEWGIELPPNTTVVTPKLDDPSLQLSDTGL